MTHKTGPKTLGIVLTHTRRGPEPSLEGRRRLLHALALLSGQKLDGLLISGGLPGPDGLSLARLYADWLRPLLPPHTPLLLEEGSRDTRESLQNLAALLPDLQQQGLERVVMISGARHLQRAQMLLEGLGGWPGLPVAWSPTPDRVPLVEQLKEACYRTWTRLDPQAQSPLTEHLRERRARSCMSPDQERLAPPDRLGELQPEQEAWLQQLPAPRILVTIPCHNEGPYLAPVVEAARRHADCVVVIDDGSTDNTRAVAEAAGAWVVAHPVNRGYGAALRSCLGVARALRATVLVTLDGDGQHDPSDLPAIVAPVLSGQAELVIGSRFLGSQAAVPAYRRFGIGVITSLYNLGHAPITDAQSGYRAWSARLVQALDPHDPGMGMSVETLIQARQGGFRILEVPSRVRYHAGGSSLHPVRHGVGVAWKVVVHRLVCEAGLP